MSRLKSHILIISFIGLHILCVSYMQTPQQPNLAAAAAGKFDGAENPPEKNAAGQISAEDKKCGGRRIFFRPVFGGGTKSAPALCNSNTHYYTVKLLI